MPTSKTGSSGTQATKKTKKTTTKAKRGSTSRAKSNGRLVIVESPAKAKTIEQYLGRGYTVTASMGHIRDLPKSTLGVDVDARLRTEVPDPSRQGQDWSRSSKRASQNAQGSDPRDRPRPRRRGDCLASGPGDRSRTTSRSAASCSTRSRRTRSRKRCSIRARSTWISSTPSRRGACSTGSSVTRVSPLLWKKVKRGLSAGRVQTAALRIVVDREREIQAFVPVEYWSLDAELATTSTAR